MSKNRKIQKTKTKTNLKKCIVMRNPTVMERNPDAR